MDPLPKVRITRPFISLRNRTPWNKKDKDLLYLLTIDEYNNLPFGTVLTSITNNTVTKTIHSQEHGHEDYIDLDTESGFISYGILESQIEYVAGA